MKPPLTLTVRQPARVVQELSEYCVKRVLTITAAVKQELMDNLAANTGKPSAYDLGKDLFGPQTDAAPTEDIARHSQRLLRERFRGKKGRKRKTKVEQ